MESGQLHAPAALPPGRIGDRVGPRAGLDAVEKQKIFPLPGIPLQYKKYNLLLIIILQLLLL
jgi:hypothetical protein